MKRLTFTVTGRNEIRLNNPQTVDPLNEYTIRIKEFTNVHHSRRDEDHYRALADLEVESKIYWTDELGVYIPSSWIMEAIAKESFTQTKISKAKMRSGVFMTTDKIKLYYAGEDRVRTKNDVVLDPSFRVSGVFKIGQSKVVKYQPRFQGWSFTAELDFDERLFTEAEIKKILTVAVKYNGFGDFRPTYGCGSITEWSVVDTPEELAA